MTQVFDVGDKVQYVGPQDGGEFTPKPNQQGTVIEKPEWAVGGDVDRMVQFEPGSITEGGNGKLYIKVEHLAPAQQLKAGDKVRYVGPENAYGPFTPGREFTATIESTNELLRPGHFLTIGWPKGAYRNWAGGRTHIRPEHLALVVEQPTEKPLAVGDRVVPTENRGVSGMLLPTSLRDVEGGIDQVDGTDKVRVRYDNGRTRWFLRTQLRRAEPKVEAPVVVEPEVPAVQTFNPGDRIVHKAGATVWGEDAPDYSDRIAGKVGTVVRRYAVDTARGTTNPLYLTKWEQNLGLVGNELIVCANEIEAAPEPEAEGPVLAIGTKVRHIAGSTINGVTTRHFDKYIEGQIGVVQAEPDFQYADGFRHYIVHFPDADFVGYGRNQLALRSTELEPVVEQITIPAPTPAATPIQEVVTTVGDLARFGLDYPGAAIRNTAFEVDADGKMTSGSRVTVYFTVTETAPEPEPQPLRERDRVRLKVAEDANGNWSYAAVGDVGTIVAVEEDYSLRVPLAYRVQFDRIGRKDIHRAEQLERV